VNVILTFNVLISVYLLTCYLFLINYNYIVLRYTFFSREYEDVKARQLDTSWYVNPSMSSETNVQKSIKEEAFSHAYDLVL